MTHPLRGAAAIVGQGYSQLGSVPGVSAMELLAQAAERAVEDAGLDFSDIDGLCAGTFYHFWPTLSVAEYLRIEPAWSNADMVGGSSFMAHVQQAALAIQAGLCHTVLIAYGSNARSLRDGAGLIETPWTERWSAPAIPIAGYALAATRHMHQYGTTRAHLAEVAVAARKWAQRNPLATARDELALDDVLAAPQIATPFSKYDCCLVSDGAAAIVLTSADHAAHGRRKPVYVLGAASAHRHREIAQMGDLTSTAAVQSGRAAFAMAGVAPKDVDVVQVYDAFTLNTLLFLEDLGFCAKGEGGAFVEGGAIAPGGRLAVNTSGGGLSFVHPGAYGLFGLSESVLQLRGETGARQVEGARLAVAHGNGGTLSHQSTVVLGTADYL
ncbi:MAG TPA: acetyl-CoA acetyltransferase [Bordetella sp.]